MGCKGCLVIFVGFVVGGLVGIGIGWGVEEFLFHVVGHDGWWSLLLLAFPIVGAIVGAGIGSVFSNGGSSGGSNYSGGSSSTGTDVPQCPYCNSYQVNTEMDFPLRWKICLKCGSKFDEHRVG